ncbi:MAG: hypothetical protein IBX45_11780 [Campylobacterales bacterium]|nr:hypothetical protein [Campylobacterales bacterium]
MPPFNLAIILFVGLELCYYLLIAQTGIVEVLHSHLFAIAPLPIGGMIGSYVSSHVAVKMEKKVIALLLLQLLMTLFYPHFTLVTLFLLGFSVGGMAPLIIHALKGRSVFDLLFSLSLAYTVGTLLFTTNPVSRMLLGVVLSVGALLAFLAIKHCEPYTTQRFPLQNIGRYSLAMMGFWVFLDSALFETLSRDIAIPLWRGGYHVEIIFFHIIGVVVGVFSKSNQHQTSVAILVLFALSYLFYFLHEAWLLSLVYPFVISYYNVAILQRLISTLDLKSIGLYMIFIGWVASGAGLLVALEQWIMYLPVCFFVVFVYLLGQKINYKLSKEVYRV